MTAAPQATPHCAVCGAPGGVRRAAVPVVRAVASRRRRAAACSAGSGLWMIGAVAARGVRRGAADRRGGPLSDGRDADVAEFVPQALRDRRSGRRIRRAAGRAERASHPPAHADASGRARRRLPADLGAGARCRAARRGRRDESSRDRRRAARAAAAPARTTRAAASSIPRIALRHRLQYDVHGLDRSRHRMLGEDGHLVVELDVHGAPIAADPRRGDGRGVAALERAHGRARRDPAGWSTGAGAASRPTSRSASSPSRCGTASARRSRPRASGSRAVRPRRCSWRGVGPDQRWAMEVLGSARGDGRRARRREPAVPAAPARRPSRQRRRQRERGRAHRRADRGPHDPDGRRRPTR